MFFVFLCPSASSASESSTWASMARLVLNRANEFIHIHKARYWIGLRVYIPVVFQEERASVCVCLFWLVLKLSVHCLMCVCVCVRACVFVCACMRACVRVWLGAACSVC